MNAKNSFVKVLLLIFLLIGCSNLAYYQSIDDRYEIIAADALEDCSIQRKGQGGIRIHKGVNKVGKFGDYIYAKKTDGSYWILNIIKDHDQAKVTDCVIGPLDIKKCKNIIKFKEQDNLKFEWQVK
ncbi:MAG: hypothetical protein HQK83_20350 [Fibrobacteria bacterium]|nr:hypothetical protein [Fibrobacteria bacterium]